MKQKEISPVRLLLRWAGPEKKWLIGSVLCAFGSGLLAITAYLGLYRLMDAVLSGACTPAVIADCAVFVMAGTVGRMVPVSYTHLDVYKRQGLSWSSIS